MKSFALGVLFVTFFLAGCAPSVEQIRTRGVSQFEIGNLDNAEHDFGTVLNQRPTDPDALFYMGRVSHARGQFERAIHYYEGCLIARPDYPGAAQYLEQAKNDVGEGESSPSPDGSESK
jgi:tetratricopeptide (TPR) repeat protein